jgi:hypothetical protein
MKTYEDGIKLAKKIIDNFPNTLPEFGDVLNPDNKDAQEIYGSLVKYSSYFRGTEQIIVLANEDQIDMVEEFKIFLENFNYQPIILFSPENYNEYWNTTRDFQAIPERKQCYVALVTQDDRWKGIDYDIKISEFDQDSFFCILDFLM